MPSPFPNLPPEDRGMVHPLYHASRVLRDNPWQDPTNRDLFVYTPPGYADERDRSYPTVLVLAAFAGTGEKFLARSFTGFSLATRIDRLIADGCPPFIAVLPDCMTSLGGSQYVDSPGVGAYASYVTREIIPFVSARFRTARWGAAGHSSGGFGALHLAMNCPGLLEAVASHAGDVGFDLCYLGDLAKAVSGVAAAGGLEAFLQTFWDQSDPGGASFAALNIIAMACAYSPDPQASPVPARLPVDFETGAVDFEVFSSWRRLDPLVQLEDPARAEALRGLRLLYFDAGDRDEYGLQLGARRLAAALSAHGIPHVHEEFAGGHRDLVARYDVGLPRVVAALSEPPR